MGDIYYVAYMDLYHVINKGVDGRTIFMDKQDYARFVHDLYEFNDMEPASEFSRTLSLEDTNVGRTTSHIRTRIVDIHGWVLMKNHFHLLLSERVPGGITLFLRKLSGYARYFNERHGRQGTLFQGRTKRILISTHAHLLYILHYIHANPLDYLPNATEWRDRDKGLIANLKTSLSFLHEYRWSSYPDYCGHKNFPSILTTSFFNAIFDSYPSAFKEFLHDRSINDIDKKSLEY